MLYDLDIVLLQGERALDRAGSYFAIRDIALGKDERSFTRLMLNGQPTFMLGPLDQSWWPGGLYTAPADEALQDGIEITKRLGFNTARKHVKAEPARWYYHCDRLGLLVWQDMPNGSLRRSAPDNLRVAPADAEDAQRPPESAEQFESELAALIDALKFFPSIVVWVPFNEGWGQYDVQRIDSFVRERDPTRLVNATSGWTDRGVGDVFDAHMYPGPGMERVPPQRQLCWASSAAWAGRSRGTCGGPTSATGAIAPISAARFLDLSAQATALRPGRNVLAATGQPAGELRGLDLGLYAVE